MSRCTLSYSDFTDWIVSFSEMYGDDGSVQRRSASYVHPYDDEGGFDEGSDEDDDSNRSDM